MVLDMMERLRDLEISATMLRDAMQNLRAYFKAGVELEALSRTSA